MSTFAKDSIMNQLYPCAHCSGSGTCTNGKENESCFVCNKEAKAKVGSKNLVCSVCGGIGLAEIKSDRINRRTAPLLAILIAYFALIFVFFLAFTNNQHFSEGLAFSGTLIGSITGYYFGGNSKGK